MKTFIFFIHASLITFSFSISVNKSKVSNSKSSIKQSGLLNVVTEDSALWKPDKILNYPNPSEAPRMPTQFDWNIQKDAQIDHLKVFKMLMGTKKKYSLEESGMTTFEPTTVNNLKQLIYRPKNYNHEQFYEELTKLKNENNARLNAFSYSMGVRNNVTV